MADIKDFIMKEMSKQIEQDLMNKKDELLLELMNDYKKVEQVRLDKIDKNYVQKLKDIKNIENKNITEDYRQSLIDEAFNRKMGYVSDAQETTRVYNLLAEYASNGLLTDSDIEKAINNIKLSGSMNDTDRQQAGLKTQANNNQMASVEAMRKNIIKKFKVLNEEGIKRNKQQQKLHEIHSPSGPPKGAFNPIGEHMKTLKTASPNTYVGKTMGFTSARPSSLYDKGYEPDISQVPINKHNETIERFYDKKNRGVVSSTKSYSHNKGVYTRTVDLTDNVDDKGNLKNYLVYDYETVGTQGNKNFSPTQIAFKGKVGSTDVNYGSFVELSKDTKKYLEGIVGRLETDSLTQVEKMHALWLRDIKAGKDASGNDVLTAYHHEQDINKDLTAQMIQEIKEGFYNITGQDASGRKRTFANLKSQKQIEGDLLNILTKQGVNLSDIMFAGHNISGYDNELLMKMLGHSLGGQKFKYFDTMTVAKKLFGIGDTNNGKTLYNYTAEELGRFLGVDTKQIMTTFMDNNKNSIVQGLAQNFASGNGLALLHSALGDVIPEEHIMKFLASKIVNEHGKKLVTSTFEEGKVYQATTSMYRRHKDEGMFVDKQGVKTALNVSEGQAWNNRLVSSKSGYVVGATKKIGSNRYSVELKDADFGFTSLLTASSPEELQDRLSYVLSTEGQSEKDYKKSGNTLNRAFEELFNNSRLFMDLVNKGSQAETFSEQQEAIKNILLNSSKGKELLNNRTLKTIVSNLSNLEGMDTGSTNTIRTIALKAIGKELGITSNMPLSASEIAKEIANRNGPKDFNSMKAYYREFLKDIGFGLDKQTYGHLLSAINKINPAQGEKGLYGIARMISKALGSSSYGFETEKIKYNSVNAIAEANKTINWKATKNIIEGIADNYKRHFTSDATKALYESEKGNRIGKMMVGESLHNRFKAIGIKSQGLGREDKPTDKNGFVEGSLGKDLSELEKVVKSVGGLGIKYISSDDGKSIRILMGKEQDVAQGKEVASMSIPIADEKGDIVYKGTTRADTLRFLVEGGYGGKDLNFRIGSSAQEMVRNLIRMMSYTESKEDKIPMQQQLLKGQYESVTGLVKWITNQTFDSAAALETNRALRELEGDETEGGNQKEMWAKRSRIQFGSGIDRLVSILGLDRISNGQGGYYSAQEANAILTDFITLSTQGLGESFLIENSNNPLIHAFLNSGKGVARQLGNFAKTHLPQAQLESLKEQGYFGKGQINFGGARDLVAGADLNSMTKRAHTQIQHILKRADQNLIDGRQQRIVSGHSNALNEDLLTSESSMYNVGGITDSLINSVVQSRLKMFESKDISSLSQTDQDYYQELTRYNNGMMPAVNEDGILITKKALKSMEALRSNRVEITEEILRDDNFKSFLSDIGISQEDLLKLQENDRLAIDNNKIKNGRIWGKDNSKKRLDKETGDVFDSFVYQDGKLLLNYDKLITSKEGLKVLFEGPGWRTTVNSIVSQRFMNDIAKEAGFDITGREMDIAVQQKALKKTTVPNAIAQYEELIDRYLEQNPNVSPDELNSILTNVNPALGRYFTAKTFEDGVTRLSSYATRSKDGQFNLLDKNGNLLFENEEQATKFVNDSLTDLAVALTNDLRKINPTASVELPQNQKGFTLYRSRASLANEYQWRRANGFDTYRNTSAFGSLKVDDKSRQTMLRRISAMENSNGNVDQKALQAYKDAWLAYVGQDGDPYYQKNLEKGNLITQAIQATGDKIQLDNKEVFEINRQDLLDWDVGTSMSIMDGVHGGYLKSTYAGTPYAQLVKKARKQGKLSNSNFKYLHINLDDVNVALGGGEGAGSAYGLTKGLYIPILETMVNGNEVNAYSFEKAFAQIVSDIKPDTIGEKLNEHISSMYAKMANPAFNKEGSLNADINKKVVGNAMSGTARGMNLEQEAVFDENKGVLGYKNIIVGTENLKDMLRISADLWAEDSKLGVDADNLTRARQNLSYLYRDLIEQTQGKKVANKYADFKVTQDNMEDVLSQIAEMVDINGQFANTKRGIGRISANLLRWPLTMDMGQAAVDLVVDSMKGNSTNITINSGLAKLMKADYDSDTIYTALTLMAQNYGSFEEFLEARKGHDIMANKQALQSQILSKQQRDDYLSSSQEIANKQEAAEATGNYLFGKGAQDALETIIAKRNFSLIGAFSNVNTSVRRMFDDIGLGSTAKKGSKNYQKDQITGAILNAFDEYFEQDSIDSKKIAGILDKVYAQGGSQADKQGQALSALRSLEETYKIFSNSDYDIDKNPEHWQNVMDELKKRNMFKKVGEGADEKYVLQSRQMDNIFSALETTYNLSEAEIKQVLGYGENESYVTVENGVRRYSIDVDKIANLYTYAEQQGKLRNPVLYGKNLMAMRYNYLTENKSYDRDNVHKLFERAMSLKIKRDDYIERNQINTYVEELLNATLNTDNGQHKYTIKGLDGSIKNVDYVSVTEAGNKLFGEDYTPKAEVADIDATIKQLWAEVKASPNVSSVDFLSMPLENGEIVSNWLNNTAIKGQAEKTIKLEDYYSNRGTAIHAIFEQFEKDKIFENKDLFLENGELNREAFSKKVEELSSYKEAISRYTSLNEASQKMIGKDLFNLEVDMQNIKDITTLYAQNREVFNNLGNIPVLSEFETAMQLATKDKTGTPHSLVLAGTADGITERGVTDFKIKGHIGGLLESWQLNTLWRNKRAQMDKDLAKIGLSRGENVNITDKQFEQILGLGDEASPLLQSLLKEGKSDSYRRMLQYYVNGESPLLTIQQFAKNAQGWYLAEHSFDEMEDSTYNALTTHLQQIIQNPNTTYSVRQQLKELATTHRINTLRRSESVAVNMEGKAINPNNPKDLLYGIENIEQAFELYNTVDKATQDKLRKNPDFQKLFGLTFEKGDLKKKGLQSAFQNYLLTGGAIEEFQLEELRKYADNPDEEHWSKNRQQIVFDTSEQIVKSMIGSSDLYDYYAIEASNPNESFFAGRRDENGILKRVDLGNNFKFTDNNISGKLSDEALEQLSTINTFVHTHKGESSLPSLADIEQLENLVKLQKELTGTISLENFGIHTDKENFNIDVKRIKEIEDEQGFDWKAFKSLFAKEDLSDEDFKQIKESDFGKLFLADDGTRRLAHEFLAEKTVLEPFKIQNMVEALQNNGLNLEDVFSSDSQILSKVQEVGGAEVDKLRSASEFSSNIKTLYDNYLTARQEETKLSETKNAISKWENYNQAKLNLQNNFGTNNLDFSGKSLEQAKSLIQEQVLKDTGVSYDDLFSSWKKKFEKAFNGEKTGEDFNATIESLMADLETQLTKKANKVVSDMGIDTSTSESIQSGIEAKKVAIAQSEQATVKAGEKLEGEVEKINNYTQGQIKYQGLLKRAVALEKEMELARQGKGETGKDLKTISAELDKLYNGSEGDTLEGLAHQAGVDISGKNGVKGIVQNIAKKELRMDEQEKSHKIKEGIHDIENLQKMLASGAPTQFTDSMARAFENVATKVGKDSNLQDGIQQIVSQMSDIQKIQMLQSTYEQFGATLAQDRNIAKQQVALEQQMTRMSWRGEQLDKTSIVNPWQNKMMQTQKTMLGLEEIRVQGELQAQMSAVKGTPDEKKFQEQREFNEELKKTNKTFLETQRNSMRGAVGLQQFGQSFKGMLNTAFQYGVVYRGAQALIQQMYTVVSAVKEFDTLEAQIRMTRDVNKETAADMIATYRDIANEYGTLTSAVAQSAITFLRQGRTVADTNTLIEQSTTLAKVGFMEEAEAAELLTATLNGFNLEAKNAAEVVDLVAYTDTIAATSAQELMTAFQYVASSADVAGFEVEKLNAMIATSSETTRLSASTIGQAYKTMVSRLQQVKIGSLVDEETGEDISNMDKMLKQYGVDIMDINGKMKDGDVILEELSKKWKSWGNDTAKKREAVEALAGVRQGNIAMSLMDNWDRYEEILADTEANASGSSNSKMEAHSESINASIAKLQNALHDVSSSKGATGLYKWVIDLATGFINLKTPILVFSGLLLLLKNQGAGLNAVYNTYIGTVERLSNVFRRNLTPELYAQQQAQQNIMASNVGVITGGGLTAFVDPITNAVSEPIQNNVAMSTLAFNNEKVLKENLIKAGRVTPEDIAKNQTVWNGSLRGQEMLQKARIQYAKIDGYGISDKFAQGVHNVLGINELNGNITSEQRSLLMRSIGASAYAGFNDEQISNFLHDTFGFEVDAQGNVTVDSKRLTEENVTAIEQKGQQLKEKNPDLNKERDTEDNLELLNSIIKEVTNSFNLLKDKIQEVAGKKQEESTVTNQVTQDKKKESAVVNQVTQDKKKESTVTNQVTQDKREESTVTNQVTQDKREESVVTDQVTQDKREESVVTDQVTQDKREESTAIEKNIVSERMETVANDKNTNSENNETAANMRSSASEGSGGTGGGSLNPKALLAKKLGPWMMVTSMLGALGGSMGASQLASDVGASDSASSMIGMGASMLPMIASAIHPVAGIIVGSVEGVLGTFYKMWRENQERIKEQARQTFATAEEKIKSLKENLQDIEEEDFVSRYRDLLQGVNSQTGENVSLTEEEYKEFQSLDNTLLENRESLIESYDAEGNAILNRNKLMEEAIKLDKERIKTEKEKMYGDKTVNTVALQDKKDDYDKNLNQMLNDLHKTLGEPATLIGSTIMGLTEGLELNEIPKAKEYINQAIKDIKEGKEDFIYYDFEYDEELEESSSSITIEGLEKILTLLEKTEREYHSTSKEYVADMANYYKNIASVQSGYDTLNKNQQEVIGDYLNNVDYKYTDVTTGYDTILPMVNDIISALNSEFGAKISKFVEEQKNWTLAKSKEQKQEILESLTYQGREITEAEWEILRSSNIVNKNISYQGYLDNKDGKYSIDKLVADNTVVTEIQKKMVDSQKSMDLSQFTQKELEELNNNWDSIVFKNIEGGFKDIKVAFDDWKEHVEDSFSELINITAVSKYTEGVETLKTSIKEYRETLYRDEKGNLQFTLTPEVYNNLLGIQKSYNLSDKQISYALENENTGEWELKADNVDRLIHVILDNTFKDRTYTLQELNMLDANFRSQGVIGAKTVGYNEFLRQMVTDGYINLSNNALIENDDKKMNSEQVEMFSAIKNDDDFMKELDFNYLQKTSELSTAEGAVDFFKEKINIVGDSTETLINNLTKTSAAFGGFADMINTLINSTLFTKDFDKLDSIMSDETANASELKPLLERALGKDLTGVTESELWFMAATAGEQYQADLQYRIDNYDKVNSTDALKVGQAEAEYRQALRQERDLRQQLDDLVKEQELEDVTLIIDKLQLSLDKLNKTISTLGNTMELIDPLDFGGKFENIEKQMENSNQVLQEASENWVVLNEEYKKAAESGNGEALQKIGETMSSYSDAITENQIKMMQLKKESIKILVDSATKEIEQIATVTERELKILEMHRKGSSLSDFSFINTSSVLSPLNFLPNVSKSKLEETREETDLIVDEEQKRQALINKIKEESLQVIYNKSKEKRTQDIQDTKEDLEEALKQIEIASANKADAIATYSKDALKKALEEFDDWLTKKDFTLVINTSIAEVESGNPTLQAAKDRGFKKVDALGNVTDEWDEDNYNAFVKEMGAKRGYNDAWHLAQIDAQLRKQLEAEGHKYGGNSEWDKKGADAKSERKNIEEALFATYGISSNSEQVQIADVNPYADLIANESRKAVSIYEKNGSYWEVVGIEQDGIYLRGANGETYKYQYEGLQEGKFYRPNAYSNPNTPISNGPITVAEKAPEFVMFKNGEGAIFDKTTILNGAEVDFVSDASYANGGKSNGTPVTAYADGGNENSAIKTAEKVSDTVAEHNENVVTNIETTNEEIKNNIVETNKETTDNIVNTNDINKKNTSDTLKEIETTVDTGLESVTTKFEVAMNNLKELAFIGGDSTMANIAKLFIGQENTDGKFSFGRNEEWCADFVSYIADLAGIPEDKLPRTSGVANLRSFFESNNQTVAKPQVGDIFMQGNKHAGIVTEVHADGSITVVEGNSGNRNNYKSKVATRTLSSDEYSNLTFGRIASYDSGTIQGDFEHFGIMSEKRGEYKIDKETGEWIYEPEETVVDTDKYAVVSGEDSQRIRSRQFEIGTNDAPQIPETEDKKNEEEQPITPQNTTKKQWDEYHKAMIDAIPLQFLSDSFREGYNDLTRVTTRNLNIIKKSLTDTSTSISEVSQLMEEHNNISFEKNMTLTVNSLTSGLNSYYEQLDLLNNKLIPEAIASKNSEQIQSVYELYDSILEKINSINDEFNKLVEEAANRYKEQVSIMLADIESVFIKLSDRIKDIDMQMNMLNDWNLEDKVRLSWEKVLNQENANQATKAELQTLKRQETELKNFLVQGLSEDFGMELKRRGNIDIKQMVDAVLNKDGTINVKQAAHYRNVLSAFEQSNEGILSTEAKNMTVKLLSVLDELEFIGPKINESETELDQGIQETFNGINAAIEAEKAQMEQSYEYRKSLYNAIIDNTSTIKELIDMEGQLLKETNYLGKATNMANSYNAAVNNVNALQTNEQNLQKEQNRLEKFFERYGFSIAEGFNASGEEVSGSYMAQQRREWIEELQQARLANNAQEISRLAQLISGYDMYAKVLVDQNENQQNLQSTLVSTLEAQKELIEQGKNYLQQYMEEMISQYKANTDTNSLINDRLSAIGEALGKFNRDEQLSILHSQLINNAHENSNLIGQQSAITNARNELVQEMENVVPNIDVNSLFTSKGEIMSSAYNQAKKFMDEMQETGQITLEQYTTWMQRVDQVGELKKQELDIENQIIDNEKTQIQLAEEQINLIKEGYDWQISKMTSLLELTNRRFETENKIFELRADLDKELRSAKQSMQWLTKSERLKIFNEEDYAQLYQSLDKMQSQAQEYYDDYYSQMMGLTEETLYQQEFITSEYERRMELVEAEYALTQKRVDLEKEQLKLKNVASEKSERMYVNGSWRQVAKTEDLISASEAVADAEKNYELAQQERLQKIQEKQMNSYLDHLKQIQAVLENSIEATSEEEEALIMRLTGSIEKLIGSPVSEGALQLVIDNLTTDLHNYEQITGTIINVELKQAVETLANVTNGLQDQIENQIDSLTQEREQISDTLDYFEEEINLIDTDNVVTDLRNLGDAIKDVIRNFKQIEIPKVEEDDLLDSDVKFNQEAYDIINNIVWYKKVWANGNDDDKAWAQQQAAPLYKKLEEMGYTSQAQALHGMNANEAENLKDNLKISQEKEWNGVTTQAVNTQRIDKANGDWAQLSNLINQYAYTVAQAEQGSQADKEFANSNTQTLLKEISKLELNGVEQQASQLLQNLHEQGSNYLLDFASKIELQNNSNKTLADRWSNIVSNSYDNESLLLEKERISADLNAQRQSNIALQNTSSAQSIAESTQLYGSTTTLLGTGVGAFNEGVVQFVDKGGKTFTVVADSMKGTVDIMDSNGKYERITVDNFDGSVQEFAKLPQDFQEAIKSAYSISANVNSGSSSSGGSRGSSSSSSGGSSSSSSGSKNNATATLPNGTTVGVYINSAGKTQTSLPTGSVVHTGGGDYKITGGSAGNYTSTKVEKKASGILSADNKIYNIDEVGKEIVIPSGRLRMMEYGDQVIPHNISENLLKWGTLNPSLLRQLSPEHTNNVTNNKTLEVNIDNVNLENVTNGENFMPELNRYLQRMNSLS